ncbi:hypothetical protein G3I15_35115 [Streptomyces sp. SID10244]|nr:hypothetical protein [Streptomyces sp. SID10244]
MEDNDGISCPEHCLNLAQKPPEGNQTVFKRRARYIKDNRLPDVLALIQALGQATKARRTERGLAKELQGKPRSSSSWLQVGREHNEFFRVREEGPENKAHISLISRFVLDEIESEDGDARLPPATPETLAFLLELATSMEEKEQKLANEWKTVLLPILISLVAATSSIAAAIIGATHKPSPPPPPNQEHVTVDKVR